jgi:hypothetical protein
MSHTRSRLSSNPLCIGLGNWASTNRIRLMRIFFTLTLVCAGLVHVWFSAVSVHATDGTNKLGPNEELFANQSITSADGRFTLILQSDGNIVVYQNAVRPLWESATVGSGATRLVMQSDGNLVAYRPDNVPVWASNTVGSPSELIMQSDGNLVIYRVGGGATWATGTYPYAHQIDRVSTLGPNQLLFPGQVLASPDGKYTLSIESSGNLVLRNSTAQVIWATNTAGTGAERLIMQSDGNLVLYRRNTSVVWTTNTSNRTGSESRLRLGSDGSLAVTHGGSTVWTTKPPQSSPTPDNSQLRPTISYDKRTSTLSGSGFLPNATIYVRVMRSDLNGFITNNIRSDGSGHLPANTWLGLGDLGNTCVRPHTITITANDNRWDPSAKNYLWSYGAVVTCD